MSRRASWCAFVALVVLVDPAAVAAQVPSGDSLAALLPARLAQARRVSVQPYSRFATASYVLPDGRPASMQLHEVIGAGSEAYQRSSCPRMLRLARRDVCVRTSDGQVTLSWVLDDTLQIMLGAPDEATATRLARALDLRPLVRLAASARAAHRDDDDDDASEGAIASAPEPAAPPATPPTPRPRILSLPTPVYPADARTRGVEGTVVVQIEVAADGSLTSATVRSGDPALTAAALDAVRGGRFEAARDEHGDPVAASAPVLVRFRLED